jgi:glutaconate CoA-transferase subunit B
VSKRMRILSLHPGVTIEQVQKQTGFELVVDGTPAVTSMPSAEELRVLRENVDSTGVLHDKRRA